MSIISELAIELLKGPLVLAYVAAPLVASLLVRLQSRWQFYALVFACFVLGLVVSSGADQIHHAYSNIFEGISWMLAVFGIIWSLAFCVPSLAVYFILAQMKGPGISIELLVGFLGGLLSFFLVVLPSLVFVVLFSAE